MTGKHLVRRNSLGDYLHDVFIPNKLAGGSLHTRRQYINAVAKLCLFTEKDICLGEVTESLVSRFHDWLIDQDIGPETVRKYVAYIRRIVRHWQPGRFPKRAGKCPGQPAVGLLMDKLPDVEGGLFRFFKTCYIPERMVGCALGSIVQMAVAIRRFAKYLGRPPMLTDLTDETVARHMQWGLDQGLSRDTVNSGRASLLALWRHANRRKLLTDPPTVEKLKRIKRLPEAWTVDEIGRILKACAETPGVVEDLRAREFWPALVLVLFDTGMRLGAAMQIHRAHLDVGEAWFFVPGDNQKQKADQRFRLSAEAMEAIAKIWEPERELLFPFPFSRREVFAKFARILFRAGLKKSHRDGFHKIRRTTASYVAKVAGPEAAGRQLGHSGAAVTARYIDPRIATPDLDGVAFLPRPNGGNGRRFDQ